jgi:hypothetical protein
MTRQNQLSVKAVQPPSIDQQDRRHAAIVP